MNQLTKPNGTALSKSAYDAVFDPAQLDDMVSSTGGFSVVSIRGSKWRIKTGGVETVSVDGDGDPVSTAAVVIVRVSPNLSKIYYSKQYEEGDEQPPDCFSLDGKHPDQSVPNPQSSSCATCPHNVWGSRTTDAGVKAKRCSDNKRIAIIPAARRSEDIDLNLLRNEERGGPMLLRVPPASLKDLTAYANQLKARYGKNYNNYITVLGFDSTKSYPHIVFRAVREASAAEKDIIAEAYYSDVVNNILNTTAELVEDQSVTEPAQKAKPVQTVNTDLEEPSPPEMGELDEMEEMEEAPKPKPKPAAKQQAAKPAAKQQAAKPAAKPAPKKDDVIEDIDDVIAELESGGF